MIRPNRVIEVSPRLSAKGRAGSTLFDKASTTCWGGLFHGPINEERFSPRTFFHPVALWVPSAEGSPLGHYLQRLGCGLGFPDDLPVDASGTGSSAGDSGKGTRSRPQRPHQPQAQRLADPGWQKLCPRGGRIDSFRRRGIQDLEKEGHPDRLDPRLIKARQVAGKHRFPERLFFSLPRKGPIHYNQSR